jgi:hypothetical protein
MLREVPCVLMRGGSSKGLFFLESDLPARPDARDRLLLSAMGSPDLRQIDGLGGGDDQSSKVMIVRASRRTGIDAEYRFGQVSVSRDLVDFSPTSGNMLAAVAPFAIAHGLVEAGPVITRVRLFDRNTRKVVEADVQTPGGRVAYQGDFRLDGVPGTGAPIRLRFLDPAGGASGRLLPTGNAIDVVAGIPVSCSHFGNPVVMVAAADVGCTGHESKSALDADADLLARLEALRRAAARRMGMGDVTGRALPKLIMLAEGRAGGTIASRYLAPTACHATYALTGAIAVLAACNTPGSLAARIANPLTQDTEQITIEHPSGRIAASCRIAGRMAESVPRIDVATVVATARPLFTGHAFVRARRSSPRAGVSDAVGAAA